MKAAVAEFTIGLKTTSGISVGRRLRHGGLPIAAVRRSSADILRMPVELDPALSVPPRPRLAIHGRLRTQGSSIGASSGSSM
jgi:hypothetical protein